MVFVVTTKTELDPPLNFYLNCFFEMPFAVVVS